VVHPAANPVSTVNSRNSNAPARDTNPVPSALTLTRPVRRLLFTYGVLSCVVALDLLKPKFPLQNRHFRAFGRCVANGRVKEAGVNGGTDSARRSRVRAWNYRLSRKQRMRQGWHAPCAHGPDSW
jgi:hypothetical protein